MHLHHVVNEHTMQAVCKAMERFGELHGEPLHIRILLNSRLHILHFQVGIRLVGMRLEEVAAERRKSVPILLQGVNFCVGNASKHGGVDVVMFCRLAGIDIAGDVEVVAIAAYFLTAHLFGEARDVLAVAHGVGNLLDVAGTKTVLLAVFHESLVGIDDEHIVLLTMLLQHHDERRNACAEEDVGWKTDDGIDIVFLYEVGADLLLLASTEQHAVRQYDSQNAIGFQVMKLMEQEGIVCLRLGSHAIVFETGIVLTVSRIPLLRVGRVADHGIHIKWLTCLAAHFLHWPVLVERVSTTCVDVAGLYATHHQVHTSEVVGILLQLLSIVFHTVLVSYVSSYRLTYGYKQ